MNRSAKKGSKKQTLSKGRKLPAKRILSVLPVKKSLHLGHLVWQGNDIYESASQTTAGQRYQLSVLPNGMITCQCPSYKKHRGRLCKHGERVKCVHDRFTNEDRAPWPIGYEIPEKYAASKNHIVASMDFYRHNVRRRELPFVRYADGRTLLAHKESLRCTWEKRAFALLRDLLRAIASDYPGVVRPYTFGPPGRSTTDRVFAVMVKVMEDKSIARTVQRIDRSVYREVLGDQLGKNSVYRYYQDPYVHQVLEHCLRLMAIMVSPITRVIDIDSSGFPTIAQTNYRGDDKGKHKIRPYAVYYRGHVVSCAATNIVGVVIPSFSYGEDSSDYSQFVPLLQRAAELWRFSHVLADKAYFSDEHMKAADDIGAMFICPPKVNWVMTNSDYPLLARRLYDLYLNHRQEFDRWYSWRCKIESVFSTIELLYGKAIWARGPYSQSKPQLTVPLPIQTELIAKFVAQNLSQFAFLEAVLEQEVSFTKNVMLHPLEPDRVLSGRTLLAGVA